MGSNFKYELRSEVATMALQIAGERVNDPKNILMNYFDS
jgi:hypothetical protein